MDIKKFLFKNRSYTPLPLIIIALYGAKPDKMSIITGSILIILGEVLRIWGVSYAGPGTREIRVKASQLVKEGPFAYQRNPLYTGNIVMYAGFAIFANYLLPWLPIAVFLYFVIQYYLIILHEEEFLNKKFGSEYEKYMNNVNRFLPKPKKYRSENYVKPDIVEAVKSERRTFQSIILLSAVLIIRSVYF